MLLYEMRWPLRVLNSGEFYQKSYPRLLPGSIAEKELGWLLSGPVWQVTALGRLVFGCFRVAEGLAAEADRDHAASLPNRVLAVETSIATTSVFATTADAPAASASFSTNESMCAE
jgi:hypothetical protein